MNWDALLQTTKIVAGIVGPLVEGISKLVEQWEDAPPEAAAQRQEALALIGQLQLALKGALYRDDVRDLEAP